MRRPINHLLNSVWIAIALIFFAILPLVFAQEDQVDLEESARYAFGQELQFSLKIADASDVDKITLNVRPKFSTWNYVFEVPFEPGEAVSITHIVPVSKVNLSPFTQVKYHWQIQRGDITQRSAEETFNYEDDRFAWQQMTQNGVTVHWTGSGPFFGQDILTVAGEPLNQLISLLSIAELNPFDIYVYPSSADLRAALRLAGINEVTNSHPDLGVILVTAVNPQSAISELGQSLPYEIAQLLLYNVSIDEFGKIPWWLRDGIGIMVQLEPNPRFDQILIDALSSQQTIPMTELCVRTERSGDRMQLASAQSKSFVEYILERYGEQTLSELVTTYIEGDACEIGIKRIIGITMEELESDWLQSQQEQNPIANFISNYGIWFLLLIFGTVIMVLIISSTKQL